MERPAPDPSTATAPSTALVRALRRVLRPLVRVMIARGLTLPMLVEMLKSLMVDVAHREFGIAGKPPTDSRISLVTGVHRKDVSRLRQAAGEPDDAVPSSVSLGAQLMATWLGSPDYLDAEGRPRPLARFASEGEALSFESLVAGVNSDIRPRVVLDVWVRLGLVKVDEARRVQLNAEAFVPAEGSDEKAVYLGHNLHDHAAAAVHNLLGGAPPFLERSVHYDAVDPVVVEKLAAQAQSVGMKALLAINKAALAGGQPPSEEVGPRQRFTFGIYFYSEPAVDGDDTPAAPVPPQPGSPA